MPNQIHAPSPAESYQHKHPPVINVNVEMKDKSTFGQHVADKVAAIVGSWAFIITQSIFLIAWMVVNTYLVVMIARDPNYLKAWDPYPFILLNLVLSFQAAYTGPVVMMSQNRQSQRDRLMAEHDFEINMKAEKEIEVILKELVHQDKLIWQAIKRIEAIHEALPVQEIVKTALNEKDGLDKAN
ncbi:MAG: DUF1003 domain-containing protein [Armatimonadota bacterium]